MEVLEMIKEFFASSEWNGFITAAIALLSTPLVLSIITFIKNLVKGAKEKKEKLIRAKKDEMRDDKILELEVRLTKAEEERTLIEKKLLDVCEHRMKDIHEDELKIMKEKDTSIEDALKKAEELIKKGE